MRHVEVGGVKYACPFADLLRPLSAAEYADLRASVAEHERFLQPAIVCTTPTHGPTWVDGLNRERVSRETGVPLRVTDLGALSDEAAAAAAADANERRRHLTADEVAALRGRRNELILRLRNEDRLSTRVIAEKVGVDKMTVQRTISKHSDKPSVSGDTVQGRDGVERPAYSHTPRVARRPSQEAPAPAVPRVEVVLERDPEPAPASPAYLGHHVYVGTAGEFLQAVREQLAAAPTGERLTFEWSVARPA